MRRGSAIKSGLAAGLTVSLLLGGFARSQVQAPSTAPAAASPAVPPGCLRGVRVIRPECAPPAPAPQPAPAGVQPGPNPSCLRGVEVVRPECAPPPARPMVEPGPTPGPAPTVQPGPTPAPTPAPTPKVEPAPMPGPPPTVEPKVEPAPNPAPPAASSAGAAGSPQFAWVHQLFADAAWARAQEAPAERPALTAESYLAAQDATTSATGAALSQMGARFAAGSDALAQLARQRQDLEAAWKDTDRRLLQAIGEQKTEAAARLRADAAAKEARLAQLDADIRQRFPEYASLVSPQALSVPETQGLLRPDEAVLMLLPGERGTHVFAVSSLGVHWSQAELTQEQLDVAVRRLRCGAIESACGSDMAPVAYDRETAHRLYRALVAPALPVLAGKSEVFVVASGALGSLPFAMLVVENAPGGAEDNDAFRRTTWLIDRFALTTLPSVASLKALRTFQAARNEGGTFRGFGDPAFGQTASGAPARRGGAATTRTRLRAPGDLFRSGGVSKGGAALASPAIIRQSFAELPGTRVELEAMQTALQAPPSALALGLEATEASVKAAPLREARVLHFATHGVLGGEVQGLAEPGLIFTPPAEPTVQDDGILTASEAAQLDLAADWVILSACNTAGGDGTPGAEGLSGLARAFFYAGARALLVSHWPVLDDIAAQLTVDTVRRQRADPGLSRAKALQQAIISARNDPTKDWAHPGAWSPFVLVGETREVPAVR